MIKTTKISFDLDGTLDNILIKNIAITLSQDLNNVIYIFTSRKPTEYDIKYVNRIVDGIYLFYDSVFYDQTEKWKKIKELNIDLHFDDDISECFSIEENTNCKTILVNIKRSEFDG